MVVGKSVPEDRDDRYFGFVQDHSSKQKRRLFEVLQEQSLQINQGITFLTEGAGNVRELAERMSPWAEHILDWFHLTVLGQYAKGLKYHDAEQADEAAKQLEKIKWCLRNGNVRDALFWAECLADELWGMASDYPSLKRFARTAAEFCTYVANNAGAIPNYAERRRFGERVATSFVESTVNLVVVERRAPAAADPGAGARRHAMDDVRRWYPGLAANDEDGSTPATAA